MHISWRLARRPGTRLPMVEDFERVEQDLDLGLSEGEVLLANRFLSLDPYMRWRMNDAKSYAPPVALGDVMVGTTVSEVLESRHTVFKAGDLVIGPGGWQSHSRLDGERLRKLDLGGLSPTLALGALGSPGFTAWAGLHHIGRPTEGETLVVGAATGPVGAMVGQLARLSGARAVAICGGEIKTKLAREHFGFDAALDHRSATLAGDLAETVLQGIDVYFENVGGGVLQAVHPLLNDFARIPVCGLAAQYNAPPLTGDVSGFMQAILVKRLLWRGFIVTDYQADFPQFLSEVAPLVESGRIKTLEERRKGLETAPAALIDVLSGRNHGKMIVEIG